MSGGMDITIKSVHWMQAEETAGGNIGSWARAGVELTGVDSKVVIHDCIWDFNTGFAMLMNKDGIKLTVTNCLFRFSKPLDNSVWAGQGIDISAALLDTVIIRNCTWYGGGPFMLKTWESTDVLFVMDHCNFVDFVQWPIHSVHWVNSEFTNNLFYNAYTMGEDSAQVKGQDPEELPFGVLNVDSMYFDAEGNIDDAKEAARRIIVKNNNNFVKQNIKDYWAVCEADPATYHEFRAPDPTFYDGFMNSRTRAMFEDDATWPNLEMENTTSLDPEFEDYFDYSDTLIAYSKAFYSYAWPNAEPTMFMMDPDGDPLIPTDPMVYDLKIGQNYPNPFNPTTNINFAVNKPSHIKLTVYNQLGQKVATLVNEQLIAGNYKVTWDASKMSSGIYFYRINADNHTQTHKMILLK
ncbi:MAG: T9SS type A sorting domain-containing protein, partial [bacterium]